jgi:hypothetical protein
MRSKCLDRYPTIFGDPFQWNLFGPYEDIPSTEHPGPKDLLVSHRTSWGILPQTPVFSLRSARCMKAFDAAREAGRRHTKVHGESIEKGPSKWNIV